MKASYLKTAVNAQQFPETTKNEIVLLGRSNVGKSSFINTLCNRKNLAYTSSTPGMTKTLNFYETEGFVLTDAPGYGFQAKNKGEYESFSKIMEEYFNNRKQVKLALLLLDIRREPNNDDLDMLEYLKNKHLAIMIILTKCDKVSNNVLNNQLKMISQTLGINIDHLYPTSSLTKKGYDKVLTKIISTVL